MSRTTGNGPSGNQPDDGDCVVCGDPADGIDAPTRQPICRKCATIRTDGGEDQFSERVDEMVREIETEVDDSTPAEAMLYARCSAAFEDAVNNTDLPAENALGVVTAALFEAADTVGYARSDVIETAREHYVDGDDLDRGDGPVTDGGRDVSAGRRHVTSSINFGGASSNHVSTPGEDVNHLSGEVSIEVSGASTDYPHPTRLQREIEAAVSDVLDDYAEHVGDDVDRGDGIETDGGRLPEGQPIDPLVCPRGHHAVDVDATRFGCETCRANDLEPARWDKSELVDLRTEEPPLVDDGDDRGRLMADGGVTTYDCPDCGEIEKCNVDDAGQRRCPDCGRAVTAVVTDGGPELVMGRRSRVEECNCGATVIGYLDGDPCPDCGEVIYS